MNILNYEFTGEGMQRVFENEKWTVGIKNWKPANDVTGIDCLERHNKTDELFVLLDGRCTLLYADDDNGKAVNIGKVEMEPMKVYKIPATLWHNTVTWPGVKLVLIENNPTDMTNSDVCDLSAAQLEEIQKLV